MDRVIMGFEAPENATVEHNGVEFEVRTFMGLVEQVGLISNYVTTYFGKQGGLLPDLTHSYLNAEFTFMGHIIDKFTNIDAESLPEDIFVDRVFWDKIFSKIVNYPDFRNKLGYVINEMKQEEALAHSVGSVLEGLVTELLKFADKFADMTPADLEKAADAGIKLMNKLEETSIISTGATPTAKKPARKKKATDDRQA